MKTHLRWIVTGLVLGTLFLWLAFKDTAPAQALAVLRRAHWEPALLTLGTSLGFMALKGLRWARLLRRVAPVDAGFLHRLLYAGSAANLVIAHTGEVLRATLLARRTGASASAILATIAVERTFDFAALAVLACLAIALDPHLSGALAAAGALGAGVVLVAVAGAFMLLRASPLAMRIGQALLRPLPERWRERVTGLLTRGRVGLEALLDPAAAARVGMLSLLQWACVVAAIVFSGAAVGVSVPLPSALAVFVLMVIGLTMPAPPAHLGTTQLAFVFGYGLVGIPADAAVAASLIYTGCVNLPVMLIGALIGGISDWSARPPGAARAV